MATTEPTDLKRAFARYRATQAAIRGRAAPSIADIDAALKARVALFERLVETGWTAPEPVARQIDLDAALVVQPHGSLGG